MTIALIGSVTGGTGTTTSFTQAPVANDYLLLTVTANQTATPATCDTPSGWTALGTKNTAGGINNNAVFQFGKVAVGGDTAPTLVTAGTTRLWRMAMWSGVDPASPTWGVGTGVGVNTGTSGTLTDTSITASGPGLLLGASSQRNNTANSMTGDAPMTDLVAETATTPNLCIAQDPTTGSQAAGVDWTNGSGEPTSLVSVMLREAVANVNIDATRPETFASTSTVSVDASIDATRPETFDSTATLMIDHPIDATRPETFGSTSTLAVDAALEATRSETFGSTSTLVVGGDALMVVARPETFASTSTLSILVPPPEPGTHQTRGWTTSLEGVGIYGGDLAEVSPGCTLPVCRACLTLPPDGLGLPELRTADSAYIAKDGVRHHSDFYEPRIITQIVAVGGDCGLGSARENVAAISQVWKRRCDDTELVIWPPSDCPCDGPAAPDMARPLGIIGRPRQAPLTYDRGGNASLTLRFDAVDHRMYLLDCCGTPGSGGSCVTLTPTSSRFCQTFPMCFPSCYPVDTTIPGSGPQVANVTGTECVWPTITLTGSLTNPILENTTTGDMLTYAGTVRAGATVIIDTETLTATEDGSPRTHLLSGDLGLVVGGNTLTMRSFGSDTGRADICWRPFVVTA